MCQDGNRISTVLKRVPVSSLPPSLVSRYASCPGLVPGWRLHASSVAGGTTVQVQVSTYCSCSSPGFGDQQRQGSFLALSEMQVTPPEGWQWHGGSALLIDYISAPFSAALCCAVLRVPGYEPALPISATTAQLLRVRRTTRPTSQQLLNQPTPRPRRTENLSIYAAHCRNRRQSPSLPAGCWSCAADTERSLLSTPSLTTSRPTASMPNPPPLLVSLCNRAQATYHPSAYFSHHTPAADHHHHHHHNDDEAAII